jgi:hypothetical protein
LTHGHFEKIQWLANEEQHNDVRDEERTAAILVRRVRETPNIAYALKSIVYTFNVGLIHATLKCFQ